MKLSFLIGLVSIFLYSCAIEPPPQNDIASKMARLDKQTEEIIGTANCSTDNQCHFIGFGDKPCGGFMSYKIYSDQNTNVALLKSKVAQYNQLSREWNIRNNRVSNCMMLMPPQLSCRNHTCK